MSELVYVRTLSSPHPCVGTRLERPAKRVEKHCFRRKMMTPSEEVRRGHSRAPIKRAEEGVNASARGSPVIKTYSVGYYEVLAFSRKAHPPAQGKQAQHKG